MHGRDREDRFFTYPNIRSRYDTGREVRMDPARTRRPATDPSPAGPDRARPRPGRGTSGRARRSSPLLPTALAALLLVPACASTGAHLNEEREAISVSVPPDRLWLELEDVYRDLGLRISSTDPREQVIRSGNVPLEEGGLPRVPGGDLVSCPAPRDTPGPGLEAGAMLRVTTTLHPDGGFTDVASRVEAWRTAGGTRARRIECRSTGVLERRIAELLRRRT